MSFRIHTDYLQSFNQVESKAVDNEKGKKIKSSFQDVFDEQLQKYQEGIKISSHASKRLAQRNITLSKRDLQTLEEAMDQAEKKGAKESLMLYKDTAFIASIKNRTLITAMDPKNSKEHIFTNIDSAIIIK